MGAFNDILIADAAAFTNPDEFGEEVTYTPLMPTASNPIRAINALVIRHPPRPMNASPQWIAPKMMVQVANDATLGITPTQLDTGGDTITVAYKMGGTAQAYKIQLADGAGVDGGMMNLELK
jgi:hypothetical protein